MKQRSKSKRQIAISVALKFYKKMTIQCTDIFFHWRGETTEKKMKERIAANWRTLARTPRFGEIMFPLKRDYGIEIALSMHLLRTDSKFHP